MSNNIYKGVFTALITPFTKNNTVDYTALENIIKYQIDNGINGIVPCGTSGECPTLSHEEHEKVIELSIKFAKHNIPIIAGTGSNSTAEAIRLSKNAEASGADAVLLVNPYYNKPTQKGLYLHFKAIANSIKIPCILYNIKGRTGVNLETDTLVKLANDCKNIIAVKEASGLITQMEDVIKRTNDNFIVLSGDDNLSLELIKKGGDGVISVASNAFPKQMSVMINSALKGDIKTAEKYNSWFADFFRDCFIETNPIPIKTVMAHLGYCQEIFRLPLCSLEKEEHRTKLLSLVDRMCSDIKNKAI